MFGEKLDYSLNIKKIIPSPSHNYEKTSDILKEFAVTLIVPPVFFVTMCTIGILFLSGGK